MNKDQLDRWLSLKGWEGRVSDVMWIFTGIGDIFLIGGLTNNMHKQCVWAIPSFIFVGLLSIVWTQLEWKLANHDRFWAALSDQINRQVQ